MSPTKLGKGRSLRERAERGDPPETLGRKYPLNPIPPTPPPIAIQEMTRVVGRPVSGWFLCPDCGKMLHFSWSPKKCVNCTFSPSLSSVACANCSRRWVVGLMIWTRPHRTPITHAKVKGKVIPGQMPSDHLLTPRERAAVVAERAESRWPKENLKLFGRANRVMVCTCQGGTTLPVEGRDLRCPVHGVPGERAELQGQRYFERQQKVREPVPEWGNEARRYQRKAAGLRGEIQGQQEAEGQLARWLREDLEREQGREEGGESPGQIGMPKCEGGPGEEEG